MTLFALEFHAYPDNMRYAVALHVLLAIFGLSAVPVQAATKVHGITFGKATAVKWMVGDDESHPVELKIRALFVDTRLKEYTTGAPHDITDRLFVVRRVFRLNDSLPDETSVTPRWRWERGGWLLVDRVTAKVSQISLAEFDPLYSSSSWYRDYIAYCAVSDDGKKLSAIVAQLGRRKAVMKKALGEPTLNDTPDSTCAVPGWQRQPIRVTFQPSDGQKLTFALHGHVIDLVNDQEEDDASE
jgi:hypothetical protein